MSGSSGTNSAVPLPSSEREHADPYGQGAELDEDKGCCNCDQEHPEHGDSFSMVKKAKAPTTNAANRGFRRVATLSVY